MLENMLILNWWVATGTLLLEALLLLKLFSLLVLTLPENFFTKHLKTNFQTNFKESIFGAKQQIWHKSGLDILSERSLVNFIFLFSLFSTLMTLAYSEIFLQEPCSLCWFQRVFMYGILLLSSVAILQKTDPRYQVNNILVFSFFGAVVSLYQHIMQIVAIYGTKLPCPSTSVDCSTLTLYEYNHITFPWMAFVLFVFFIVVILLQRKLK